MGIFKNITRTLKQAAPVIGSAIGMYFGGPVGAAVGSGIGSLAAGRSTEEALRNAALTGATTYAIGGKDFGKGFNFSTSGSPFAGREVVGQSRVPSFMGGRVVDSVPVGKLEEYIQEYKSEFPENNKKNGGKYAKDSVVDFIIDID